MLNFLLSVLISLIVSHSQVYPSDTLNLCNGINVDNVTNVIDQEYTDLRIVRLNTGDNILIFDSCGQYRAYVIESTGIERIEF